VKRRHFPATLCDLTKLRQSQSRAKLELKKLRQLQLRQLQQQVRRLQLSRRL
jgi:hypothetical protein